MYQTSYFKKLRQEVESLGGFLNAHLHIDRTDTYFETQNFLKNFENLSSLSLSSKHSLIPAIHEHCYKPKILNSRVESYLEILHHLGTFRADTLVDVTDDVVGDTALNELIFLKRKWLSKIDFRLGAYSPLGFKQGDHNSWNLLVNASKKADFIGSLPERDDKYQYPDHIGFNEHCEKFIDLSIRLEKPLHVHVDQKNLSSEDGSERFLSILKNFESSINSVATEPHFWLVHVISPSTYDEIRFKKLIENLKRYNIGVICCPSAAISMRQVRPIFSPTYNSIARVLEMLSEGIPVRIGSDNICDITSPAGTPDLMDELFVLCNALRFYEIDVLAKIAAGKVLSNEQVQKIKKHLEADKLEVNKIISSHQ